MQIYCIISADKRICMLDCLPTDNLVHCIQDIRKLPVELLKMKAHCYSISNWKALQTNKTDSKILNTTGAPWVFIEMKPFFKNNISLAEFMMYYVHISKKKPSVHFASVWKISSSSFIKMDNEERKIYLQPNHIAIVIVNILYLQFCKSQLSLTETLTRL